MQLKRVLTVATLLAFCGMSGVSVADSEFEKYMQQEMQAFGKFREERDQQFTEYLKKQWKEFEEFQGLQQDTTPKPAALPVVEDPASHDARFTAKYKKNPPPPVKTGKVQAEVTPAPVPQQKPAPGFSPAPVVTAPKPAPVTAPVPVVVAPAPVMTTAVQPEQKPAPVVEKKTPKTVEFGYLGHTFSAPFDPALAPRLTAVSNDGISKYWEKMATAEFTPTVQFFAETKARLKLNDWGFYRMVAEFSRAAAPAPAEAELLTWFFLAKGGLNVKAGFNDTGIYLLAPANTTIYSVPYFTFGKVRFYNISVAGTSKPAPGALYTYEGSYPQASRAFDLKLTQTPLVKAEVGERVLTFSYGDGKYSVKAKYDKQLVAFYATYPQTELNIRFGAEPSSFAAESLAEGLKPVIAGRTQDEAVNMILRFTQTAFEYKTDDDQFGKERPLFLDETLYYPYSDCEDRSIFFSYLVKRLTGLDVVGLDYPGHVATAVKFTDKVSGDAWILSGSRFVVADPTYINASIGMTMPVVKKDIPKPILF